MPVTDIGIDLGSSNILVYSRGKGIVIREPSVAAYDKDNDKIVAFGEEARQMIEHTQGNIVAIRPLKSGVISDYSVTEQLLRHFIQKTMGRRAYRKPYISICVPSGVTEVERRAVEEAAYQAGAREVTIVDESVAAAIGAGIDITKPVGNMIVDIGGGTTDIAVISLGAPVVLTTIRVGGDNFDEAITRYLRRSHSLFIGEMQAENIKIKIGTACKRPNPESMQVTGRNVITGLPKTISINAEEVRQAISDSTTEIVEAVHGVLEKTPPELAADISERGIVLTGGGALLDGFETMIEERTGINVMTAENPGNAVVIGTGLYTEKMDELSRMEV
ncbi:MAG TPA: rod shape-determining protein [Lachnospiraceae bacterium]|nr:rod shape-determining protein [Lachnospiraceae bacterium]